MPGTGRARRRVVPGIARVFDIRLRPTLRTTAAPPPLPAAHAEICAASNGQRPPAQRAPPEILPRPWRLAQSPRRAAFCPRGDARRGDRPGPQRLTRTSPNHRENATTRGARRAGRPPRRAGRGTRAEPAPSRAAPKPPAENRGRRGFGSARPRAAPGQGPAFQGSENEGGAERATTARERMRE